MKQQPILKGRNIFLRPLKTADARQMFDSLTDQEVARLTGTHDTFTFEQVEAFCSRVGDDPDRFDYVICTEAGPTPLGEVVLNEIDWPNKSGSFRGAIYTQQDFGRGLGTESIQLLVDFAFDELKLNRVELEVFEYNERAIHVYEKIGFQHEGRKREALQWEGKFYDALVMSLLASDRIT
jgi:RimJ/RimL family protein N-acetyltransferase